MTNDQKVEEPEQGDKRISRRDFLKYSVGVAAVAAGATALMDRLPITTGDARGRPASNARPNSSEPIVAAVNGDQLTVMNGQVSVKVNDAALAALIASKLQGSN